MSAALRRFAVVGGGDELRAGAAHDLDAFPLHVTVLPPFAAVSASAVAHGLRVASRPPRFVVVGTSQARFRPEGDIPVTLVGDDPARELHRELRRLAREAGWPAIESAYNDAGYAPHVTATRSAQLGVGERMRITRLALVELIEPPVIRHVQLLAEPIDALAVQPAEPRRSGGSTTDR